MLLHSRKSKKSLIIIFFGAILILVSIGIIFFACNSTSKLVVNNNIDDYVKRSSMYTYSKQVMPSLVNLPKYKKIYYEFRGNQYGYETETMLLAVTYDKKTYISEKSKLKNYQFLSHSVLETLLTDRKYYAIPEYEFSINKFTFKVLNNHDYPHNFGMIVTSDSEDTVVYMYFSDPSFDYISKNETKGQMKSFVLDYYKYNW